MSDPLGLFRSRDASQEDQAHAGFEHTLLLFEHEGALYGVGANTVDALVAWRKPAPLPASVRGLAGVVQDRGRIIMVLASPLGDPMAAATSPQRIVICTTKSGFVGLPCGVTRHVGTVVLAEEPVSGHMTDSSAGPLVFVDPEAIVRKLRSE